MPRSTSTPPPAMQRFLEVTTALRKQKSWRDDWDLLRWAAIPLVLSEGAPADVAARVRAMIQELRERATWWRDIVGSARTFVAGSLVAGGTTAREFMGEVERVRAHLRVQRLRRSSTEEVLAILVLLGATRDGRVDDGHVQRMADLYRRVRRDHRWLLGVSEYPTLALLATTTTAPETIGARIEAIYADLQARGFRGPSALMPIPQLLYFHPESDKAVSARFESLWRTFKGLGLGMRRSDYDEVALLTFAPGSPRTIAKRVIEHRDTIRTLKPRPNRDTSFSLACATTFLELAERTPMVGQLSRVQAAYQVRCVIAQRQAAMAAAT